MLRAMTINNESVAPLTDEGLETPKLGLALKRLSAQVEGLQSNSAIQRMQQQIKALLPDPALMKILGQTRSLIPGPAMMKALKPIRPLLPDPALTKMLRQIKPLLPDQTLTRMLEQITPLIPSSALTLSTSRYNLSLNKALRSQLSSIQTVNELITELQARGLNLSEPPEIIAEQLQHQIECEGAATATAIGIAQVTSENPRSLATLSIPYLWAVLILLLTALGNWNDLRQGICDINGRIPPTESLSSTRKFVRVRLCGLPIADARIVKADHANLRSAPSMKARIITQLSKNQVVAVVSKENRKWLLVSIQQDGAVIEGWVSRSYLKTVQ